MRVEHLRSFIAVAESGSFTKASERLFTAQPVVTRHIAALEKELHVKLIERTTRSLSLTQEGEVFFPKVKQALQVLDSGIGDVECLAARNKSAIAVGFNYLYMDKFATAWIDDFRCENESLFDVEIVEEGPEMLLEGVLRGELDAAFVGTTSSSVIRQPIKRIRVDSTEEVIVMGKHHPLANRASVNVHDVSSLKYVYPHQIPSVVSSPVRRDLADLGINVGIRQTEFQSSALKLVSMSDAVIDLPAVCPVHNDDVVRVPYESVYSIDYSFIWNPGNKKDSLRRLVSFVESKVKEKTTVVAADV